MIDKIEGGLGHASTQTRGLSFGGMMSFAVGCSEGYTVVWCELSGGHGLPDNPGAAIWVFFSQIRTAAGPAVRDVSIR